MNKTGTYIFEDENLDLFGVFDYKQTTITHGLNRDDQFYEDQKFVKPRYRIHKYPTKEEFWDTKDVKEFKYLTFSYTLLRKF